MKISAIFLLLGLCTALNAQETHFSSDDNVLYIPLAVLDGNVYFEDVRILMFQDSGTFTIVSGTQIPMPEGPYQIGLNWDTFAQLITGNEVRYVNLIQDSRCPIGVECITAGEVQINMFVVDDNDQEQSVSLTLSGTGNPNSAGEFAAGIYFRLLEVNPYPVFGQPTPEFSDTDILIEYSVEPF